jgi:hypothetical protein
VIHSHDFDPTTNSLTFTYTKPFTSDDEQLSMRVIERFLLGPPPATELTIRWYLLDSPPDSAL